MATWGCRRWRKVRIAGKTTQQALGTYPSSS